MDTSILNRLDNTIAVVCISRSDNRFNYFHPYYCFRLKSHREKFLPGWSPLMNKLFSVSLSSKFVDEKEICLFRFIGSHRPLTQVNPAVHRIVAHGSFIGSGCDGGGGGGGGAAVAPPVE